MVSSSGRFTSNERKQLRILRLKFLSINLVFLLCWLPNLINAIAVWTLWFHLPREPILVSAYFMAFLNPLQALLNVFVYRKWGDHPSVVRIRFPWTQWTVPAEEVHLLQSREENDNDDLNNSFSTTLPSEKQKSSNVSINGYGSF